MEARRQELLNEEDGYWRQRMDQQQLVEKLKAEVAEQEELKGHSEVSLHIHACKCTFTDATEAEVTRHHAISVWLVEQCMRPTAATASQIMLGGQNE